MASLDEDIKERQENEVNVLAAIFENDMKVIRGSCPWKVWRNPEIVIHMTPFNNSRGSSEVHVSVNLRVKFTQRYPLEMPELR